MHLLSLQIPVKIDRQGQLMALLGMLRPRLPSVRNVLSFPKTAMFFESSEILFMEDYHQVSLDSPPVSLS